MTKSTAQSEQPSIHTESGNLLLESAVTIALCSLIAIAGVSELGSFLNQSFAGSAGFLQGSESTVRPLSLSGGTYKFEVTLLNND